MALDGPKDPCSLGPGGEESSGQEAKADSLLLGRTNDKHTYGLLEFDAHAGSASSADGFSIAQVRHSSSGGVCLPTDKAYSLLGCPNHLKPIARDAHSLASKTCCLPCQD